MDTTFTNSELAFLISAVGVVTLIDPSPLIETAGAFLFACIGIIGLLGYRQKEKEDSDHD